MTPEKLPSAKPSARRAGRRRFLQWLGGALAGLPFASRARCMDAARVPGVCPAQTVSGDDPYTLWYARPATPERLLFEGLPVGNGELGALVGGAPDHDVLDLACGSFWTGGRNDTFLPNGHFPYAWSGDRASLPPAYRSDAFGSFQLLARLALDIPRHALARASDYRRELDLAHGLIRVRYAVDGVDYAREVFCSHPDRVLVLRLSAQGGGSCTGRVRLTGTHHEMTAAWPGRDTFGFSATLPNGLRYAASAWVGTEGGRVAARADGVDFEDCSALTVLVTAATNYAPDAAAGLRSVDFADTARVVQGRLDAAQRLGAATLHARHVADFRRHFERMQVSLCASSPAQRALDTWSRLQLRVQLRAKSGAPDPELEAAYLQFGRHLTLSGSRDALPTNLQALWLVGNHPPWKADYHTDINLEMNYWLPDRAGLGECFAPLAEFCLAQLPAWTASTRRWFNDPHNPFRNTSGKIAGWTVAISENIYGGNGWRWHPPGNAWLCNNLWHHYEYTQDRAYLARVFPLLRGACEFWRARLIEATVTDPHTGRPRQVLVDDHDWSPEQGPDDARGITYAQELVWDLFTHFIAACRVLGRDADLADTIAGLKARLYLPRVSPTTGWLEEWMTPADLGSPTHRHLSPLIGLFPGDRILPGRSPAALIAGARKLLTARGMHSFGWGNAWRALCWARLKDGEKAYRLLLNNLVPSVGKTNGTAMNLFDVYALGKEGVFQVDSNYGTPAAMLDMLLYSRPGHIELLPALPRAWPSGHVTGIGARGGFVVDLAWDRGRPTAVTLHSVGGTRTAVVYQGVSMPVQIPVGASHVLSARSWASRA